MDAESSVNGTWKVTLVYACQPTCSNDLPDFVGASFKLDENGEVSWTVPDGIEPMSFCNCESFEVRQKDSSRCTLELYGMYPDHTFQFEVVVTADHMKMTFEDSFIFDCQRLDPSYGEDTEPYSLLNALSEGHFSDLTIVSASGKEFHVHRAVLALTQPGDRSTNVARLLHGESDSVVVTVLHYLYAECLPVGLSEDTAGACLKAVGSVEGLRDFVQLCDSFLQNTALKQQIMQLINEMDQCVDRVIGIMSGKITDASNRRAASDAHDGNQATFGDLIATNPSRLWYAATLICRELVIASGKFLVLCDLFARRRSELPREERHNIMRACHECILKFLSRLKRFLEVCQHQFSSISASQRLDIAVHIVPETEGALDLLAFYVKDLSALLDYVIKSSDRSDKTDSRTAVAEIGRALKNALHVRELAKLKKLYEKAMEGLQTLGKQRSNFSKMTHEQKIQMMNKTLEKIIDKIPAAVARIDSFIDVVDDRISWKGWKYIFKMGSSKVAFVLNKMQLHRREMRPLISRLVADVQRDQFRDSLVMLGLEDYEQQQQQAADEASASVAGSRKSQATTSFTGEPVVTKYVRLSAVESLCKSPFPASSRLSRAAGELLTSAHLADMVFDVQETDTEASNEGGASAAEPVAEGPRKSCRISAHRVILAARCSWFKRALLSGMKESIDRVITVHDTDAKTFRLFLQYAYTGIVSLSDLSIAEIADLVQLADRYEMDSLKALCEKALEQNIGEGTALYLLNLADQCQVLTLKKTVLEFIALHSTITQSEDFCSLASALQSEVFDTISSLPRDTGYNDSSASSEADVDEMIDKLEQFGERYSVSDDELAQPDDSVQLAQCVSELRIVLGANPSQEMLVQISRAADYDANRALNFFFANSPL